MGGDDRYRQKEGVVEGGGWRVRDGNVWMAVAIHVGSGWPASMVEGAVDM